MRAAASSWNARRAQAIAETELVVSEPVTVVLSRSGWVRAAKGHELDPRTLSYKTGDEFRTSARGRSTQLAVFLDSTGRAYSLPAHTLPSARGQGEPLSGRLDPPDGATFPGVLIGEPDDRWVLASAAGYGFVVKLGELHSRNRAGKTILKVPDGSTVIAPVPVPPGDDALLAAVNSDGRLLVFPVADLPELPRGKGNKIFGLSSKKIAARRGDAAGDCGRRAWPDVARVERRPAHGAVVQGTRRLPRRARPARCGAAARLAARGWAGSRRVARPAAARYITTCSGLFTK